MKKLIKIFVLVVGVGTTTLVSGCSDEQRAFWGGVLVGGVASRHYPCRLRCHSWYDFLGFRHYECHRGCFLYNAYELDGSGPAELGTLNSQNPENINIETRAIALSNEYGISYQAAERFLSAAVMSLRNGQTLALQNLGFEKQDLRKMAELNWPAPSSIDRVARKLNADRGAVELLIRDILNEANQRARQ